MAARGRNGLKTAGRSQDGWWSLTKVVLDIGVRCSLVPWGIVLKGL